MSTLIKLNSEYNRKIAVQIEGWKSRKQYYVELWTDPNEPGWEASRPPSYHSDHAALHRVVEKIGGLGWNWVITSFMGEWRAELEGTYRGQGDTILEALYLSVCQYLDQIGGVMPKKYDPKKDKCGNCTKWNPYFIRCEMTMDKKHASGTCPNHKKKST